VGARGICRDISEDRERDAQLARAHMRERLFGYIVRTMRDEVEPDNMLAAAAAAIARALAAQGTEIYRVTSGGPQLTVVYGAASPLAPTGCIGASLLRTGTVAVSGEGAAALAVATRYQGEVNGALFLWRDAAMGPFADDERVIVTEAAEHLGLALEQIAAHEKLKELSSTDGMTGLLNRRSFMIDLMRRFERATKGGAPGALVYCDLDNFKQVNDTHGHERGDAAICKLAEILSGSTRGEDLVARLGGDEFALWLEGANAEVALAKANLLLQRGEALKIFSGAPDCPLGMSIGVAVTEPGAEETLEQLMARADIAMYASKKRGKGRATFADPPEPDRRRAGDAR
jgi:diguanylate cyclase (GGDEF)-like protein